MASRKRFQYPGNIPAKAVRFDAEDEALLEGIATREKLTLSDALRRSVRHYAKVLEIVPEKKTA